MTAGRMNRRERRRLAKLNGLAKIKGLNTPYVNIEKKARKAAESGGEAN